MGKFVFRLKSLLNIAFNKEEEAKKVLGSCLTQLKISQEQLLALSHEQTRALRSLVEDQNGKISIHKLINDHQYCQYLKQEVESKQKEVINFEKKVEEARARLDEVIKKRKILEKLKEKQHVTYRLEEERKSQLELDEIAQNLYYTSAGGL